MELLLKISALAILFLCILYLCYKVLKKNVFFNHRLTALVAKKFYNYFHSVKEIRHLRVSNYGYAPVDEEIAGFNPDHQHGLQLYKELVRNHTGFLITECCTVLEVGCGKGGGAEYIIEKFKPRKYTGIDFSEKAIAFCKEYYPQISTTDFICGDAHQIPINCQTADVVINVESSHIYKNIDSFLKEVYRILKPGGKFLIADYRIANKCLVEPLEKKLSALGFFILEKRIITTQVHDACTQASERRKKMIDDYCPWYLKKYFRHYAMLNGTQKSDMLANGEIVYFIYQLEKR